MNVEYYTGVNERLEFPVILPPPLELVDLDDARLLIADDVADTGHTLALVRDFCRPQVADVRVRRALPEAVVGGRLRVRLAPHGPVDRLPVVQRDGDRGAHPQRLNVSGAGQVLALVGAAVDLRQHLEEALAAVLAAGDDHPAVELVLAGREALRGHAVLGQRTGQAGGTLVAQPVEPVAAHGHSLPRGPARRVFRHGLRPGRRTGTG